MKLKQVVLTVQAFKPIRGGRFFNLLGNDVPLNSLNPFGKEEMEDLMWDIESFSIEINSTSSKHSVL